MFEQVIELFETRYRKSPTHVASAPGRVNLIGEHTDYSGGFVFPVAIDRKVYVAATKVKSEFTMAFSEARGDADRFDAMSVEARNQKGFSRYVSGMAWALRKSGAGPLPNLRLAMSSDLPIGAGVSSSAALEMAVGRVWLALAGKSLDAKALAAAGRKCENEFVGVQTGVMDQLASACGQAGHALLIDTAGLEITPVSLPNEWKIVLCDTRVTRGLTSSAYNERREQCETAAKTLGVKWLRDADLVIVESKKAALDDTLYRRAKHVVSENARCLDFAKALEAKDGQMVARLMAESHASLKDDYEVSCPELDAMVESGEASPGVVGIRMTGAGFGGSCVALVRDGQVQEFIDEACDRYKIATNRTGFFRVVSSSDGASAMKLA